MEKDPYAILGVRPDALPDVVRAAYTTLAKKYHPDVAGNNPVVVERFREISEAWETVSRSREKREAWDRAKTTAQADSESKSAAEAKHASTMFERFQYGAAFLLVFGVGGFAALLLLAAATAGVFGRLSSPTAQQTGSTTMHSLVAGRNGQPVLTKETNDFLRDFAKRPIK